MIYQPTFDVPVEIAAKVASGEYALWGGVVRDEAGRIVKLLDPIVSEDVTEAAVSVSQKIAQFIKSNPKQTVVGVVGAAAMAVGAIVYSKMRAKQAEQNCPNVDSSKLSATFTSYIQALQEECLSKGVIQELLDAINEVENGIGDQPYTIELEGDYFKNLISLVRDYTVRLVNGNSDILDDVSIDIPNENDNSLNVLKGCLQAQQVVLNAV